MKEIRKSGRVVGEDGGRDHCNIVIHRRKRRGEGREESDRE